jgi:hypothetical protein
MMAGCVLASRLPTLTVRVLPPWLSGTSSEGLTEVADGNSVMVGM